MRMIPDDGEAGRSGIPGAGDRERGTRPRRPPIAGTSAPGSRPSGTLPAVTEDPQPAPPSAPVASGARRSRYVPAVLDALIPGLGHLVAGRRRLAALFLTPT